MKKPAAVIIILSIIVLGWVTARLTHVIEHYTFATNSNAPSHPQGTGFFASRLKTPDYNSFVCFKNPSTKNTAYIFRVIGRPNDIIEIKDATVYRNGQQLNEPYAWNEYLLSKTQYVSIAGFIEKNKNPLNQVSDSTYLVTLTDAEFKQYNLSNVKHTSPKGTPDAQLFTDFKGKGYNADNLGPVTVPANSYFLMGDNRHDAFDSRYLGFVKSEDIVSTMIGN
jgi:signal peptidase I